MNCESKVSVYLIRVAMWLISMIQKCTIQKIHAFRYKRIIIILKGTLFHKLMTRFYLGEILLTLAMWESSQEKQKDRSFSFQKMYRLLSFDDAALRNWT